MSDQRVLAQLDAPSVLDGWTVRDLIAHTGRCFLAVETAVTVTDAPAQTLGAYLSRYAPAAVEISEGTKAMSGEIADALLPSLDAFAVRGFEALSRLGGPVVRGPRGPIAREDFVVTRILEMVVHSDDLSRSVPSVPPVPLVPACVEVVGSSLAAVYRERAGSEPDDPAGIAWIRAATGRVASVDPNLPVL